MNTIISEGPPSARSCTALGLLRGAAKGLFMLQKCADCQMVQYPPRDACHHCLGSDLPWREVDNSGLLKAVTTIHASNEPYFQKRLPWKIGIIASDLGISMIAHLLPSCRIDEKVVLSLRVDAAGRGVLVAEALNEAESTTTDENTLRPTESDFLTDPAGLRVLITNGESELGREVAESLQERGVREIVIGKHAMNVDAVLDTN